MDDLVVFGIGELGKLFAGSALSQGLRVTPITRDDVPSERLRALPPATPILVAVGEADLDDALIALPAAALPHTILLQNELWPSLWQRHGFTPTVMLPWVLQKPGTPRIVAGSTPCFGLHRALAQRLCAGAALPHGAVPDLLSLYQALADKYAFILTINALGVWRDESLGQLLLDAPERVRALVSEAAALSGRLLDCAVDETHCQARTTAAIHAMRDVRARGRSAYARVQRALARADQLDVAMPELRACAARS